MNEKALIKKCLRGERQAFDELIRLYYDYVFGFLLKATKDKMLTEDLTQETFLKMIRNIESFSLSGNVKFATWLITIAKNCFIDYLRKNRIAFENIENIPLKDNLNLEEKAELHAEYESVLSAIKSLPEEQASAIMLKYLEDLTLAQISERLGVQQKTIKSRIHEGTVKLRKKLKYNERTDIL